MDVNFVGVPIRCELYDNIVYVIPLTIIKQKLLGAFTGVFDCFLFPAPQVCDHELASCNLSEVEVEQRCLMNVNVVVGEFPGHVSALCRLRGMKLEAM